MAGNKWNGALLGIAFAELGLLAIRGMQNATTPNFWNTVYGWFTSGAQALIDSWAPLASVGTTGMAFVIAGVIGLMIGLYVEYK